MQKMQELGNKVWEKGMEQAKPYLDKSPKVKELVSYLYICPLPYTLRAYQASVGMAKQPHCTQGCVSQINE